MEFLFLDYSIECTSMAAIYMCVDACSPVCGKFSAWFFFQHYSSPLDCINPKHTCLNAILYEYGIHIYMMVVFGRSAATTCGTYRAGEMYVVCDIHNSSSHSISPWKYLNVTPCVQHMCAVYGFLSLSGLSTCECDCSDGFRYFTVLLFNRFVIHTHFRSMEIARFVHHSHKRCGF